MRTSRSLPHVNIMCRKDYMKSTKGHRKHFTNPAFPLPSFGEFRVSASMFKTMLSGWLKSITLSLCRFTAEVANKLLHIYFARLFLSYIFLIISICAFSIFFWRNASDDKKSLLLFIIPGGPQKNGTVDFFRNLLWSTVTILFHLTG